MDAHEYAVLEETSLSAQSPGAITVLSVTSGNSSSHGYFILERPHQHLNTRQQQSAQTMTVKEGLSVGDLDPEALYSTLDHPEAEYATLEPELGNVTSVPDLLEYSHLTTGQEVHHDYQRVLPDPNSDYDRTFANS